MGYIWGKGKVYIQTRIAPSGLWWMGYIASIMMETKTMRNNRGTTIMPWNAHIHLRICICDECVCVRDNSFSNASLSKSEIPAMVKTIRKSTTRCWKCKTKRKTWETNYHRGAWLVLIRVCTAMGPFGIAKRAGCGQVPGRWPQLHSAAEAE